MPTRLQDRGPRQRGPVRRGRLIGLGLTILSFFAALAVVVHLTEFHLNDKERGLRLLQSPERDFVGAEQAFLAHLRKNPDDEHGWLMYVSLRSVIEDFAARRDAKPFLKRADFEALIDKQKTLPPIALRATEVHAVKGLDAALLYLASLPRTSLTLVTSGDLSISDKRFAEAIKYYNEALQSPINPELGARARRNIISSLLATEQYNEAFRLLSEADYQRDAAPDDLWRTRLRQGRYLEILKPLYLSEISRYTPFVVIVSLLLGLGWLYFCLRLGAMEPRASTTVLCLLAPVLGIASTIVTLWAAVISDSFLITADTERTWLFNVVYAVFGIGLREELIKLLFFLPLAPVLARLKSEATHITIASLVGLGFAAEENINYFLTDSGAAVAGRFLTSNFLHLALTGFAGYYLIRALRLRTGAAFLEFLENFGLAVAIHGLYDFVLIEPMFKQMVWLSSIAFIILSQMYLRLVTKLSPARDRKRPLAPVFTAVLAMAVGLGYLVLTINVGPLLALLHAFGGVLSLAIITIMFFREIDEPIVP